MNDVAPRFPDYDVLAKRNTPSWNAQTRAVVDPVVVGNRGELAPLGAGTGETGDAEAFAELFRLYATNRAYAERTYPNATADLERTLREGLPAQAAALKPPAAPAKAPATAKKTAVPAPAPAPLPAPAR